MDTKKQFTEKYLNSFWKRLKFQWFLRKVRRQKVTSLWESNLDKIYFETEYAKSLSYEDTDDRLALIEERKKPLDKQDQFKIAKLEENIGEAKAIKGAYYKNESFRDQTETYINMLDKWNDQD